MPGSSLDVEDLSHHYAHPSGPVRVLEGVTLTVPGGAYASLQGPSGSGKTTLLSVLGGLLAPQSGRVRVGDLELGGLGGDALAAYRRRTVGFVFQHFGLLDTLTAAENVGLAGALAGVARSERRDRAVELLTRVGLGSRAGHRPHELSGGERQRVAIARALVNRPTLLLADEPTGNLDERSAREVVEVLEQVRSERGCTVLVVTHDDELAARAQVRLVLRDQRVTG